VTAGSSIPTCEAVLRGAFLQDAGGVGDERVEVEQLVHVLPAFGRRLALLGHRDGVRVVHLDGHVVRHVAGALPRHLKARHGDAALSGEVNRHSAGDEPGGHGRVRRSLR